MVFRLRPMRPAHGLVLATVVTAGSIQLVLAANLDVEVLSDQATMLHLERSAAEIVVGNPSIADVAVQNRRWRQFRARCGRHYRGTPFSEHGPLRSRYH